MRPQSKNRPLYMLLGGILLLNILLWGYSHTLRPTWGNVPPVVSDHGAGLLTLGDRQLAYRVFGIMLQNLDSAGEIRSLKDYDYGRLSGWFHLQDRLDPLSNYTPGLAAYYFGGTQQKGDLLPVIKYLEIIGQRPQKHKWRWLAQAVYLARFQQGDLNLALQLANTLAALPRDDMPRWARQMPAFVMNAQGDKKAAYALMMQMLSSSNKDMSPTEIRFIRDYVCDQILTPEQALNEDLCQKIK